MSVLVHQICCTHGVSDTIVKVLSGFNVTDVTSLSQDSELYNIICKSLKPVQRLKFEQFIRKILESQSNPVTNDSQNKHDSPDDIDRDILIQTERSASLSEIEAQYQYARDDLENINEIILEQKDMMKISKRLQKSREYHLERMSRLRLLIIEKKKRCESGAENSSILANETLKLQQKKCGVTKTRKPCTTEVKLKFCNEVEFIDDGVTYTGELNQVEDKVPRFPFEKYHWACTNCTYLNQIQSYRCDICSSSQEGRLVETTEDITDCFVKTASSSFSTTRFDAGFDNCTTDLVLSRSRIESREETDSSKSSSTESSDNHRTCNNICDETAQVSVSKYVNNDVGNEVVNSMPEVCDASDDGCDDKNSESTVKLKPITFDEMDHNSQITRNSTEYYRGGEIDMGYAFASHDDITHNHGHNTFPSASFLRPSNYRAGLNSSRQHYPPLSSWICSSTTDTKRKMYSSGLSHRTLFTTNTTSYDGSTQDKSSSKDTSPLLNEYSSKSACTNTCSMNVDSYALMESGVADTNTESLDSEQDNRSCISISFFFKQVIIPITKRLRNFMSYWFSYR
jgi:hypothetical protein